MIMDAAGEHEGNWTCNSKRYWLAVLPFRSLHRFFDPAGASQVARFCAAKACRPARDKTKRAARVGSQQPWRQQSQSEFFLQHVCLVVS